MNNIVSTKRINAIFLAIVLVAGTIATISPSSFISGVNAQTEPYYEKDNRYSNYEQESEHMDKGYSAYEPYYPTYPNDKKYNNYGPDYPPKYTDDRKYNSYESDHYGMDNDRKSYKTNSYEPTITTSYGNDNNYQKTYGKDDIYDKSQYSSYKPDYKPQYPSYGKDKSNKDSNSKSISISKINCINTNLNLNGNNTGDINLGNKGQGYLGASSSGSGRGYIGGSEGYDNGYDNGYKKDESITCIINNNNINNNSGAGNVTDGDERDPCVECFLEANVTGPISITIGMGNIVTLEALLDLDLDIGEELELTIFDLCRLLEGLTPLLTDDQLRVLIDFLGIEITAEEEVDLIDCLLEAGIIIEGV